MKQAILIMAHKNRAQLEKLIRYFEGKCDIISIYMRVYQAYVAFIRILEFGISEIDPLNGEYLI